MSWYNEYVVILAAVEVETVAEYELESAAIA